MRKRALEASLALLLGALPIRAQEPAPSRLLQRLAQVQEQYRAPGAGLRDAQTDAERKAAVERGSACTKKLVELAEESPDDPAELEVLRATAQSIASTDSGALIAWESSTSEFPSGCAEDSAARIVALVAAHFLKSEKLEPVIDRLRYAYRLEFIGLFEKVLDQNPHREVRGAACVALARFLQDRSWMLRLVGDRPELVGCYERIFGKTYLAQLQELEGAGLARRIEALFERAATDFGIATESELYAIRRLAVGQPAPEIRGKDQDGKAFALDDYRGKVVLLYFWSEY